MNEPKIVIAERTISASTPVYVIAELSANHNQSFDEAIRLVEAAADAGADAVKLQTYTADTLTLDCRTEPFQIGGTIWDGRTLHDVYQEAFTPWEWQPLIKQKAEELGLHCFSSPFDSTSVDFLETLSVPAYKIASFEMVDLPLIRKVASTGKPLIMSTGMATLEEIEEAVEAFRAAGGVQLALLKCTSSYPSPPAEMNLRTIADLGRRFGVVAGISDHSLEAAIPVAAVALGARIIEKHLTMSRSQPGPDSAFSLEPLEFKEMVRSIRICEQAFGEVRYAPTAKEQATRVYRRSLFAVKDIASGEPFTELNVRSIRPGHGLHTRFYEQVLRAKAARAIPKGTPLAWDDVAKNL